MITSRQQAIALPGELPRASDTYSIQKSFAHSRQYQLLVKPRQVWYTCSNEEQKRQ